MAAQGVTLVVVSGLRPGSRWRSIARWSGRYGYTATLLLDDSVLLTGDYDDKSRASAELYDPGVGT